MQHKQVLIVDSNELNREMLRDILQDQYTVLEAQNAQQALDVLQKQAEEIALILMDVISARDGYMFLDS
ncbi:MAG: response regulator, partial [Clostridia bacterium]|nr:response regulator [Clostridia bacterium]